MSQDYKGGNASLDELITTAQQSQPATAEVERALAPSPTLVVPSSAVAVETATVETASAGKAPVVVDTKDEVAEDKSVKKDKDKPVKPTRLIYSDNEVSPEEKMAALPRYGFNVTQRALQT